jgi:hypothetical protein
MLIHEDQKNVKAMCEIAEFIDSGFQSFKEQVELPPAKLAEAAFYAGAALAMKLSEHFKWTAEEYGDGAPDFLRGVIMDEVNAYMERNHMKLEWEPHVPRSWQQ